MMRFVSETCVKCYTSNLSLSQLLNEMMMMRQLVPSLDSYNRTPRSASYFPDTPRFMSLKFDGSGDRTYKFRQFDPPELLPLCRPLKRNRFPIKSRLK